MSLQRSAELDTLSLTDRESDRESIINEHFFNEHMNEFELNNSLPDNREEIETRIRNYIRLIRVDVTDEQKKRDLIVRLCELRIRLNELNEEEDLNFTNGHRLIEKGLSINRSCEVCLKRSKSILIMPLLGVSSTNGNSMLTCQFCQYSVHRLCSANMDKIRRCPRLQFDEIRKSTTDDKSNPFVILSICPEVGLYQQNFQCNECHVRISLETSQLCDYDGYYYCRSHCFSGDQSIIPARVIHNWDFQPRLVSKRSFFIINYILYKPVLFDILQLNAMLYGFVDELSLIKQVRHKLYLMNKYIKLCKQPSKPKLTIRKHLIDDSQINSYSLHELMHLRSLKDELLVFHSELLEHITKICESCRGNGFFCELCGDKSDLLFPFSPNISSCPKCSAVYHKNCFYRKKICRRCDRLEQKKMLRSQMIANANDTDSNNDDDDDDGNDDA